MAAVPLLLVSLALVTGALLARRIAIHRRVIRRLEAEIRAGREQDRVAARSVPEVAERRFVAALAHDLRTPLSAIVGYHDLIADGIYGPVDAALYDPLHRIGDAARQLEQLLAGTVEFARPAGEPPTLDIQDVPLLPLLDAAVGRATELAAERRARLTVERPTAEVTLRTDPRRLEWLIDLALATAVRGSPRSSLHVDVRITAGSELEIHVHGTGFARSTFIPRSIAEFAGPDARAYASPPASARDPRPAATGPDPADSPPLDGDDDSGRASLRLGIVRRLATQIGGELDLLPGPEARTLQLRIPGATAV